MQSAELEFTLRNCRLLTDGEGFLLGDMLRQLGRSGFCFAAFLLAVPFLQPFSLGPLTMLGGVTFVVIGWQMIRGYPNPVPPKSASDLRIKGSGWGGVLGLCLRILEQSRRFTKVRLQTWVSGDHGERLVGWLILSGGALLVVPMANLPFNNTLPALMIVFACIGWLERDGAMIVVSLFWGVATLIYFTVVGLLLFFFGSQIFSWIGNLWPFR